MILFDYDNISNHNYDDSRYQIMKSEREKLNFCDQISLWWFFHSTPTGDSSYPKDNKNICCSWCNCCPGNLELKFRKIGCKEDKICLLICCSLIFE